MPPLSGYPNKQFELTTQKLKGIEFYLFEPTGFNYNWLHMVRWATETFSDPGKIWPEHNFVWPQDIRWGTNLGNFWFRNEADRTLFLLRWKE